MSKFFCPLPWMHQFIQADGIKMCCSSRTLLDLTSTEFANSSYIKNVKETIANGDIPPDCQTCVQSERKGFSSTRTLALKDWKYDIDSVPDQIEYLDLRHSNLCNLSCRSCEPKFSSQIAREISLHPTMAEYYNPASEIHLENQNDLDHLLATVKRINFTGGEPLLNKENIRILEEMIKLGNVDCEILITTNGTVINPAIVKLLKSFNSVHWTLSIDAVDAHAEYIRYGSTWDNIKNNIETILSMKQSVAINTVLSAYSVLSLGNLLKYFKSLKDTHTDQPLEIWFSNCDYPAFLKPSVLQGKLRKQAIVNLAESIDILEDIKSNPIVSIDNLKTLQNNLNDSIVNTALLNKFLKYTEDLDQIRNQNFNQTFGTDHE
jgi:organic radical activating enzyme